MNKPGERWYHDPKTRLPTIRQHPDAREYLSPEEAKRMIFDQEPDYANYPIQDNCGLCHGSYHPGRPCKETR